MILSSVEINCLSFYVVSNNLRSYNYYLTRANPKNKILCHLSPHRISLIWRGKELF
jgi:hypothetical protein